MPNIAEDIRRDEQEANCFYYDEFPDNEPPFSNPCSCLGNCCKDDEYYDYHQPTETTSDNLSEHAAPYDFVQFHSV